MKPSSNPQHSDQTSSPLSKSMKEEFSTEKKVFASVRNITKEYRPYKNLIISALNGVDLDIYEGEFVALTGHSGSGKSTLLNLLGLIDTPTSGTIFIGDEDINTFSETRKAAFRLQYTSIIFQFFNLIDNYTALENIAFQLRLQGYSRGEARKKAQETLQFLGLEKRANLFPRELSGGEQQRIAIGRAIAKDSQFILADEPTAHLDSKNSDLVLNLLQEVNKNLGKTVLLVTHEPSEAERTHRNILMKDGKVVDIHYNS
jgi:putative ABC transport system ATP-binding protein